MPPKRTHEEFITIMSKERPDLIVMGSYHNNNTPIRVSCRVCGFEWNTSTPHNLLSGKVSCPQCSPNSRIGKYTKESFAQILKGKRSDIVIEGVFIGNKNPIDIRCTKCGNIWTVPCANDLLYGHGHCLNCSKKKSDRKTTDEFIREMKEKRPELIVVGEYVNKKTPIKVKCSICGYEWGSTAPMNLLRGGGVCPICHPQKHGRQRSDADFRNELHAKRDDVVPIEEYVNEGTKIKVKCKTCEYIWRTRPSLLLRNSSRCPSCYPIGWSSRKSTESFLNEIHKIRLDIEIIGDYINSKAPIAVKCKLCGYEWSSSPAVLLKGNSKCPQCNIRNMHASQEEFENKVEKLRPDIRVVGEYIDSHTPVKVLCKTCNYEWFARPVILLQGHNKCVLCNPQSNNRKKTIAQYRDEIAIINPNIIVLSDEYLNAHTKLEFMCRLCNNTWFAVPNEVRKGTGCPQCDHSHTSFMEQVIYLSFAYALGFDNVISRDKSLISKELDIFIPSYNLALEPGSWKWHKNKVDEDAMKRMLCFEKGVNLITIYDSCPVQIDDVVCFQQDLSRSRKSTLLKKLICSIFNQYDIEYSTIDWDRIYVEAYNNSRRKM